MTCDPQTVIHVALAEAGYMEKSTSAGLDSKTANVNTFNNFTKYARDLDALSDFYNGKKQGYDWCDVFVDWCFVKAYGEKEAKKLLCQPEKSLGAGCGYSMEYYQRAGRFCTGGPQPGDQVFFGAAGKVQHTGLVYFADQGHLYTVEGNISPDSRVVSGGFMVCIKVYSLKSSRIIGYGRPNWAKEEAKKQEESTVTVTLKELTKGAKGEQVKTVQRLLESLGYDTKNGADGSFGSGTLAAVKAFQKAKGLAADGCVGIRTWEKLLGV